MADPDFIESLAQMARGEGRPVEASDAELAAAALRGAGLRVVRGAGR